jgi:hypothetical protein
MGLRCLTAILAKCCLCLPLLGQSDGGQTDAGKSASIAKKESARLDPLEGAILTAQSFALAERVQFYVDLVDKFKTSRDPRCLE